MNEQALTVPARTDVVRMRSAAAAADTAAAAGVVGDFLSRKARHTRKAHADALAAFADFLDLAGAPCAPLRAFAADVRAYPDADPDPGAWAGMTWGIVAAYVRWQLAQGYALATVNLRLSAVKVYCELAFKAGVIDTDAAALIRTVAGYSPKEAKHIDADRDLARVGNKKAAAAHLTPDQAAALKAQPDTAQGHRDRLLMCLLLDHGLRASEIAGLQVGDFDLSAGELRFYRPKVDMTQTHDLSADTLAAARGWFATDALPIGPVLRGSRKGGQLTGAGMTARAITARVRALGRAVGVANLSAHDCRHYWATYWGKRAEKLPRGVFTLQEAGGWRSLAMPRRYVELGKIANEGMI